MTSLGQKIKFFRKRAKISQFKLEEQIGASAGSLSRIESGEVNPTKETLEKIKKALNLTYIETLFFRWGIHRFIRKRRSSKSSKLSGGIFK